MKMKRISAFTLVELIVTMVFSSIIVSLAFAVFSNTNKVYHKAYDQYGKTNELLLLQSVLNQDCSMARLVIFENDIMTVEDMNCNKINYTITSDRIIRNYGAIADTFHIGTHNDSVRYLFDAPPLMESHRIELLSGDSLNFAISAQVSYTNKVKLEYSQKIKTDNYPYGY